MYVCNESACIRNTQGPRPKINRSKPWCHETVRCPDVGDRSYLDWLWGLMRNRTYGAVLHLPHVSPRVLNLVQVPAGSRWQWTRLGEMYNLLWASRSSVVMHAYVLAEGYSVDRYSVIRSCPFVLLLQPGITLSLFEGSTRIAGLEKWMKCMITQSYRRNIDVLSASQ